jgi:hypothetical protein
MADVKRTLVTCPIKLIRPSSDPYPVAMPVAKSIWSNRTMVKVPVAPANRRGAVLDRRNLRELRNIWSYEHTLTLEGARYLISTGRSEDEGPCGRARRLVDNGSEHRSELAEVGRTPLGGCGGIRQGLCLLKKFDLVVAVDVTADDRYASGR